jgi:hypothetical protein
MIAASAMTFLYRLTPYRAQFDPAVFGVLASCAIYFLMRITILRPARDSHLR